MIKVVGRAMPFHWTTELASNPLPDIVIVADTFAVTVCGEIFVMVGVGLVTL